MPPNVPLAALRVFEAAARHESFRLAGLELNMSGSAVSQQIAALESIIQARLFLRQNRRVELTQIGRTLGRSLRTIFRDIEAALVAAAPHLAANTVRVAIYQTMASRWLIPRLSALAGQSPPLSVELETGMAEIDFERTDLDFAVRVGHGRWQNAAAHKLFDEVLTPVCTPKLACSLATPAALDDVSLIHSSNRPNDWDLWLKEAGHPTVTGKARLKLANSSLAYEAAAAGAGVALGQIAFVAGDLAAGTMVTPYTVRVATGRAYYLVEPAGRRIRPAPNRFREWIIDQAAR